MDKTTNRYCKQHGETIFVLEGRGYYRCRQCRMDRVAEQRRKNKRTVVAEAGGCCQICGYSRCVRSLHFHHIDPSTKSFGLAAKGHTTGIRRMREEVKKCILLCSNCHGEVEEGLVTIPCDVMAA